MVFGPISKYSIIKLQAIGFVMCFSLALSTIPALALDEAEANRAKVDAQLQNILEHTKAIKDNLAIRLASLKNAQSRHAREAIETEILAMLQERRKDWETLLREQPINLPLRAAELVLAPTLRQELNELMPQLSSELEQVGVSESGEIEVYGALLLPENIGKLNATIYVLKTQEKSYQLHLSKDVARQLKLSTGDHIRVRNAIKFLGTEQDNLIVPDDGSSLSNVEMISTAPAAAALVAGTKRMLVIPFNFQDNTIVPNPASDLYSMIFTQTQSLRQFYIESSYGQLTFNGDVANWSTISYNSSGSCPLGSTNHTWEDAANAAAIAQGFDPSVYDHVAYIFPANNPATGVRTGCAWAGLGQIVGRKVWINANVSSSTNQFNLVGQASVTSHEIGHNLGLEHANSLNCGTAAILAEGSCSEAEYGDSSDVMGNSGFSQFNAPHKEQLGWLTASDIQTISTNGTYTLYPIEAATPSGPRAFKIDKADTSETYYISYRVSAGNFDVFNDPGAFVHVWNNDAYTDTKVLRAYPLNSLFSLRDGQRFEDQINGLTITQVSHNTNSVTLNVSFGPVVCVRANPIFSISPTTLSLNAGYAASLSLIMTNTDGIACPDSTFTVTSTKPSNWIQNPQTISQAISPNRRITLPITMAPPASASTGANTLVFNLSSSSGLSATPVNIAATVYTSDVTAPSIPRGLVAMADNTGVDLSWNASTDNVGVTNYRIWRTANGSSVAFNTPSLSYRDSSVVIGASYQYYVVAYDASGRASLASNTVEVKIPASGADSQTPVVEIISPTQSSYVSGNITIQASVTDNQAVSRVEFWLDTYTLIAQFTAAPYTFSLNTELLSNASHQIAVKGFDAAGNTNKAIVSVNVISNNSDSGGPTVDFISPTPYSTVSGLVNININAADDRAVASVAVIIDSVSVTTFNTAPYVYSWNTIGVTNTFHTLQATVRDFAGHSISKAISVTVNNNAPTATASATRTRTPTYTATFTNTRTATVTPTSIVPATFTATRTPTSVATATATIIPATPTATAFATSTATQIATSTATLAPTATQTRTPTLASTSTATALPTITTTSTPTLASTPTRTNTAVFTASATATALATSTATQLATSTATLAPTSTQTRTPTLASTSTATALPTITTTSTPTLASTATATALPTITASATPTLASTPTHTNTAVFTASATATPLATSTATQVATSTATLAPTATQTRTPTLASTSTATALPTITTTFTPTLASTATRTSTPVFTATTTATPLATSTATQLATSTATLAPSPTATRSNTATSIPATSTATPLATNTQISNPTSTATRTNTPTFTRSATATRSATRTPTPIPGSDIITPQPTATPTIGIRSGVAPVSLTLVGKRKGSFTLNVELDPLQSSADCSTSIKLSARKDFSKSIVSQVPTNGPLNIKLARNVDASKKHIVYFRAEYQCPTSTVVSLSPQVLSFDVSRIRSQKEPLRLRQWMKAFISLIPK